MTERTKKLPGQAKSFQSSFVCHWCRRLKKGYPHMVRGKWMCEDCWENYNKPAVTEDGKQVRCQRCKRFVPEIRNDGTGVFICSDCALQESR